MPSKMESIFYKCVITRNGREVFKMPKNYKRIFANNLNIPKNCTAEDRENIADIKDILSTGPTRDNYIRFFHTLLWYEETILRINLKKYNKPSLPLQREIGCYVLTVPGLAEKRPSLMIGDFLLVIPPDSGVVFEGVINDTTETTVKIQGLHKDFDAYYERNKVFEIRFILSRSSLERMHQYVQCIKQEHQESKTFPTKSKKVKKVYPISMFYNALIGNNVEQRMAVENIVSKTSGRAPYLLHGPPGTGKTVTVVEAILQLVQKNSNNRILVCTDSNMAADHVAAALVKYRTRFPQKNFLLRANSKLRAWETLPESVAPFSNGTNRDDFEEVTIQEFMSYNITITTLAHSSVYATRLKAEKYERYITHLFIDEAAQGNEPQCLIPICGLLSSKGSLILAGDPLQLGPVIISHSARSYGLGVSLMERLQKTFPMYHPEDGDPNYTVMLRNNFRSNPDILRIPNALFYNEQLNAKAAIDPISNTDILHEGHPSRAIAFHGILSREEKSSASTSFFNNMELEIVQKYVSTLVDEHGVLLEDIGVVTPYIRQASKVKSWLLEKGYEKVEVGTVEAFQGKEKRIIIVSTVRANTNMLEHDARYQLGFLVDDK
ncbi:hypothetical protein O3G_MSEX000019, partial [Manduca sexta]